MTAIPGYYTVAELAEATGLTPAGIRWHCRTGTLGAVHTDKVWLIPWVEAQVFLHLRGRGAMPDPANLCPLPIGHEGPCSHG
jgi:hypothetical protein